MTKTFIINTDGASRGNPGKAAAAFTIKTSDGVIWCEEATYLGILTNNQAEYMAVILSLEKLSQDFKNKLPAKVILQADSLLIISQLQGFYKVKSQDLKKLFKKVKKLVTEVGEVEYSFIPREENFLADKLANRCLDEK